MSNHIFISEIEVLREYVLSSSGVVMRTQHTFQQSCRNVESLFPSIHGVPNMDIDFLALLLNAADYIKVGVRL